MKKVSYLVAVGLMGAMLLTGCGASFSVSPSDLEDYADNNSGLYADVTSDYTGTSSLEGVYVMETDDIHVELWDWEDTTHASAWFQDNMEILKDESSSHSGSDTTSGGDYSFKASDNYYRLLFSDDQGIYAYGDKDALNDALIEMNVIEK
ncbi:MAG: hypothetical protein ACI4DO_07745 [Roseburia sp.]